MTCILCCLFDCGTTAEYDQVCQGYLFIAALGIIEIFLHLRQCIQYFTQLYRVVDFPVHLWFQSYPCPVGTTSVIGSPEGGS